MSSRLLTAIIVVVGVPAVLVGYIVGTEQALRLVPGRWQRRIRPWLWILPALAFLFVFLVYPAINTVNLSFKDRFTRSYVGLDNYRYFFTSPGTLGSLRNNGLWLVFLTAFAVGFGLLIAVVVDRVRYEAKAKAVFFLPLAVSFVAAAVIWRFMYDYRPPGAVQTGTLNAVVTAAGGDPVPWLIERPINNLALILVAVWMWTGFCMVIISAGLKRIDTELLEAGRVDGANEWQVFRKIILPLLRPTIAVVSTTMIIVALKAFDIVYVMTNGAHDTNVIANQMYQEMFNFGQFGRASAVAVVLLLAIIPVMVFNVRRFREQEAIR
ncbi:MAG: carbohydrate ABC transporter permease [Actinomycetota bacterium]